MKPQTTHHVFDTDAPAQFQGADLQTLDAKALRDLPEDAHLNPLPRSNIYLILDNVYDTYNIGGLFRLADALACSRICLCGASETPPNHRIKKASIGTYKVVPWTYYASAQEAITALKTDVENLQVVAVEQTPTSVPYTSISYTAPLALVVGSETHGTSEEALALCDAVAEIPMYGYNKSLNVIVSAGIVAFHALHALKK